MDHSDCVDPIEHVRALSQKDAEIARLKAGNERLTRSRDGWEDDALREAQNAAHYKAQLAEVRRPVSEDEIGRISNELLDQITNGENYDLRAALRYVAGRPLAVDPVNEEALREARDAILNAVEQDYGFDMALSEEGFLDAIRPLLGRPVKQSLKDAFIEASEEEIRWLLGDKEFDRLASQGKAVVKRALAKFDREAAKNGGGDDE